MKIKTVSVKINFIVKLVSVFFATLLIASVIFPFAIKSIIFGGAVCLVNAIAGFYFSEFAFEKNQNQFLLTVFSSMGIRLLLMLLAMFIAILNFKLPKFEILISLFGFYSIFMLIEIFYLQSKFKK